MLSWAELAISPKKTEQPIYRAIFARKILHKNFLRLSANVKAQCGTHQPPVSAPWWLCELHTFSFRALVLVRRTFYSYIVTNNRHRRPTVKIECRQRRGFSAPFLMLFLLLLRLLPLPSFPERTCSFDSLILTGPQLALLLRLAP